MTISTELKILHKPCTTCGQCVKACPQQALEQRPIVRGERKGKIHRIPYFPDPKKCVFCGVCLVVCPFDAIQMKADGEEIPKEELDLVKKEVLPKFSMLKIGKFETVPPEFSTPFWLTVKDRIEIKKRT